jgi:hypothetical protein
VEYLSTHTTIVVYWPTPTTPGVQVTYAVVGIVQGGSCALTAGKAMKIDVAVIVSIRNRAIKFVFVLFFVIFIFLFSFFLW